MGSSSVSTHRGLVHWQGLLLAVSLLNFWYLPTTEQLNIVPRIIMRGHDVTLHVHNEIQSPVRITWHRGNTTEKEKILAVLTEGSLYHMRNSVGGRISINKDGSMVIRRVSMKDAGLYTLVIQHSDTTQIELRELNVYEPARVPTLRASNTTVIDSKDAVVLTCADTDGLPIQWLFNRMNLKPRGRMTLSEDRKSLRIDPVKREDAGYYQCKVSNPISSVASDPLKLNVKCD